MGGWKVLVDICPDCANDASSQAGSTRSKSSRKSGTGRYYDPSSAGSDASTGNRSSSSGRKKKIRVKDMKYRDGNGKDGRYSGDVNEDHEPHGQGKMKYKDGTSFTGVWSEGAPFHGKSSGDKKKSEEQQQWKNVSSANTVKKDNTAKKVRKMKWMDYFGDPGEYTGEIDGDNMPHGKGSMKYDHGLIQEGMWSKGQFVEGSDVASQQAVENNGKGKEKKSSGSGGGSSRRRDARSAKGQMMDP